MGKTSAEVKNRYAAKVYDRVALNVKKGTKELIQRAADGKKLSINGYIKAAITEQYKKDTGKEIDL